MDDDIFGVNATTAATTDGKPETSEPNDAGKFVKCDSCGGNMIFDPTTQMLLCEHCGATMNFEKNRKVMEIGIQEAFKKAEQWDDATVVRCANCGARIIISSNEVAKCCPYCGTSHVRKTEELAGLRPNAIFPFTLSSDAATASAKKWAKKRLFAPSKFKKNIVANNLHGVFEPCFTFDSNTYSTYSGRIGKRRTRTVGSGKNARTETYIEWRNVSGTISRFFDDVFMSASERFDQSKLDKLLPLDYNTIVVYEKKYLAGYTANHYDEDIHATWDKAKARMDATIRQEILNKYNCDVVDRLDVSTTHNNVTYKYVLIPLYILNYHYKKKDFPVNVNGNTGKVTGKTPISFWRVLIAVMLGLAVVAGVVYLYLKSEGMIG